MSAHIMERIAKHTKTFPVNVEAAIRDLGIILCKDAKLPENIAGQIKRLDDGKFEISSTSSDHYFRQRFTIAHELAHFVLHKSLIGQGVDDNIKYRNTVEGDFYNTSIDEIHEMQANSFAACLLMPEDLLRNHVIKNQGKSLKDFAKDFKVSPSAMRWRLRSLDLYRDTMEDG